ALVGGGVARGGRDIGRGLGARGDRAGQQPSQQQERAHGEGAQCLSPNSSRPPSSTAGSGAGSTSGPMSGSPPGAAASGSASAMGWAALVGAPAWKTRAGAVGSTASEPGAGTAAARLSSGR